MVRAMIRELNDRKDYISGRIETIYLGGGTPSVLSQQEISDLLKTIHDLFEVTNDVEVTLEANPDDLTSSKLQELKQAGVNRLSIGIQSLFEEDLKFMNRSHSVQQSLDSVRLAKENGITNISVDLIFALPGKDEAWVLSNVRRIIEMDVTHVSCYGLTVEEKTVLHRQVKKGLVTPLPDEQFISQYELIMKELKDAGFVQYEISNFSKPGFFSKHNSSYWKGEQYLGIGPGAHSFNGVSRQWNIRNNPEYIRRVNSGDAYFETESLSRHDLVNEYLLTTLRTIWGTDLSVIKEKATAEEFAEIIETANSFIESGQLRISENKLLLTDKGKVICDRITSELFI